VAMLHTVRSMLADNDYVLVFSFDYSKAFDTVRPCPPSSSRTCLTILTYRTSFEPVLTIWL